MLPQQLPFGWTCSNYNAKNVILEITSFFLHFTNSCLRPALLICRSSDIFACGFGESKHNVDFSTVLMWVWWRSLAKVELRCWIVQRERNEDTGLIAGLTQLLLPESRECGYTPGCPREQPCGWASRPHSPEWWQETAVIYRMYQTDITN